MAGGASSRKAPTVEAEGRARAERTANMLYMLVTLDVSRLSGWLNADANCRVKREAWERQQHKNKEQGRQAGPGKMRVWGRRRHKHAQGEPQQQS